MSFEDERHKLNEQQRVRLLAIRLMHHKENIRVTKLLAKIAAVVVTGALGLIILALWGCPQYRVWEQEKAGEAELKRAEQNRKVKVYEAEAALQSAKLQAQAEVERAKGVAEANKIIANGLQGHDEYLRYLWIDKVAASAQREIVYVPTEASIPILESTRLKPEPAKQ